MHSTKLNHHISHQILFIELASPSTQNALHIDMARNLVELVKEYQPQGVMLSHQGPVFCSGGDLKFYQSLPSKEDGLRANQEIRSLLDELNSFPIPKIALVHGACFGGGVELLSCFDFIYCTPSSLFGLWQRRIGLSFGWGGGARLARRMGDSVVKKWLLTAETRSAYQAKKCGLVDQIELSSRLKEGGVHQMQKILRFGNESLQHLLGPEQNEVQTFQSLWMCDSHQKALKKFNS
ncbi:MAG: enoyl-CoA hydratase/isomerase family protein [Bdellovibrionales bacterium]|nr:enoyl-CoA hydratase/isomerase family protein [Bdellovibrionales bacterium]